MLAMLLKQRLFAAEKIFRPNKGPIAIAFLDLVNGKTKPYDDNGHGTHVTVSLLKK